MGDTGGKFSGLIPRRRADIDHLASGLTSRIQAVQVGRALSHLPMIYAVAIFNIVLIMVLCFHNGLPGASYGWMGVVAFFSALRMAQWIGRARSTAPIRDPQRMLRNLTIISIGLISGLSAWSVYALSTDLFADMLLIPVSLVFGSTCIAHCLAPIKRAALGVLLVGVVPAASVMLVWGDFNSRVLGASMLTITMLMVIFIIESYERITNGIVLEEKIRSLANSDALTGIANRRAIMAALADADERRGEDDSAYAIALLDLDAFKQVNDSFGHHIGDALLQVVAERLLSVALPSELVGRLGGDEFFVLMRGVADQGAASARTTAFLAALCRPAEIDGNRIPVSGSMGFALHPREGRSSGEVMMAADKALYSVKHSRRRTDASERGADMRAFHAADLIRRA